MKNNRTIKQLLDWAEAPIAEAFPYSATTFEVRRKGKHFMDEDVIEVLKHARAKATASTPESGANAILAKFLDVVLDKVDLTYNYLTYTALPVMQHDRPGPDDELDPRRLQRIHDATVCSIIADALGFELRVQDGHAEYLPDMRPGADALERRMRFALRSIDPALDRLGMAPMSEDEPLEMRVRKVVEFCRQQAHAHTPFILDITMLPVYTVHDEYLFLRILQSLDATFASVANLVKRAVSASPQAMAEPIQIATTMLNEGLKHFQTLSTMQKESFSTFREFTTGASAIQSVNYKIVESLCRNPDPERLESLAYSSVPGLQAELRNGSPSLDDRMVQMRKDRTIEPRHIQAVEEAMRGLSEVMTRWRASHFGIAKKYLGEGTGTGYSEGTPYLKMVKDIPVFKSITVDSSKCDD